MSLSFWLSEIDLQEIQRNPWKGPWGGGHRVQTVGQASG